MFKSFFKLLSNGNINIEELINNNNKDYIFWARFFNNFYFLIIIFLLLLSILYKSSLKRDLVIIFFLVVPLSFRLTICYEYKGSINLFRLLAYLIILIVAITEFFGSITLVNMNESGKLNTIMSSLEKYKSPIIISTIIIFSIIDLLIDFYGFLFNKNNHINLSSKKALYSYLYIYLSTFVFSLIGLIWLTTMKFHNILELVIITFVLSCILVLSGSIFIISYKYIKKYKCYANISLIIATAILIVLINLI